MPFLIMSTDVKIWLLCETEIKIKKEKYNVKSKSVIWFFGFNWQPFGPDWLIEHLIDCLKQFWYPKHKKISTEKEKYE